MPGKRGKKEDIDVSSMKVVDLKKELLSRGLDTYGRKADLVTRLEGAIQGAPSSKKAKVKNPSLPTSAGLPSTSVSAGDYSKMSVVELKEVLQSKGLSTSGKKQEMIGRLKAASEGVSLNKHKEGDAVEKADFTKAKMALVNRLERKKGRKVIRERKSDCGMYDSRYWDVVEDWDCTLIQNDISKNANSFYIMQLVQNQDWRTTGLWMRWGRVGEPGQSKMDSPYGNLDTHKEKFRKKFYDKTGNDWESRDNFRPVPGKYTLVEIDDESEEDDHQTSIKLAALDKTGKLPALTSLPCMLEEPTKDWIRFLYKNYMLEDALEGLEIDTKRMPLGRVSKAQVAKGIEALEVIEDAINKSKSQAVLEELTSKFYSIIPHDFGRKVPPLIEDQEMLQKKLDMLLVFGGVEIEDKNVLEVEGIPHRLDILYKSLKCDLTLVKPSSHEHQVISQYVKSTNLTTLIPTILEVWRVDRHNADDRFKEHDSITNRRLLWYEGTILDDLVNVLKSGRQITRGGFLGKGIYHSSAHTLSFHFTVYEPGAGMMILSEVALGNEYHITIPGQSLTGPPEGFDSVVIKGTTEPDPKDDILLKIDGKDVVVPQGEPFSNKVTEKDTYLSEYVVYKESQTRIRFMIKAMFERQ